VFPRIPPVPELLTNFATRKRVLSCDDVAPITRRPSSSKLNERTHSKPNQQSITILPDRRKSRKAMPRHPKVCCTDNRTQYSAVPLGVLVTITLRRRVNARTACSAEAVDSRESSRHIFGQPLLTTIRIFIDKDPTSLQVPSGASQVQALKGVTISLRGREMVPLMGPSGSGKTILLSVLGCILSPTQGTVRVHGHSTQGSTQGLTAQHDLL
jgi:ABC-type glutathione transport system ATPase component